MAIGGFTQEDYDLIKKDYDSLMEAVRLRCKDPQEVAVVQKAFEFANDAHRNVRRRSGAPYIIHPIAVAKIVVSELGLGYKSITAALLHDVVEDTDYTVEDISNLFGTKVAQLVDGLTKIKTVLDNQDKTAGQVYSESLQAENFKRILLTLGEDVRVVLIKMADRLHNCRTIEFMPEHKRDKILSETMYIFIPLAHRLGLYSIKSELENIWLRYKEPEDYAEISRRIDQNVELRDKEMDAFIAPISAALDAKGYRHTIHKRIKSPYSIWSKMRTKHVAFEEIYDLYAVRIIYEPSEPGNVDVERTDAYSILTIVTSLYSQLPSRFRNWVLHPKPNGYEALHVTLMSHAGVWVEVQIRSKRMDDIAEKGIAAHWAYKNDGYASENDSEMDHWLARVQSILSTKDVSTLELLDIIHKDLVSSDIVVFSPKGEQKQIQTGATALDFAFMIHTHIGEQAIAAKVNHKLVPLSQVLKQGDQVEIITAANAHPKVEWLQFLQTRSARSKVIDWFRPQFKEIVAKGEHICTERLKVMGLTPTKSLSKRFLAYSQLNDRSEFLFRVGLGIIGPEDFRKVINEEQATIRSTPANQLTSKGDDGTRKYIMADCCHPIPGDPVVGFLFDKNTVVVHKKSCHEAEVMASKFGNLVVATEWLVQDSEYPIRISIKGVDRIGMLNEITQCISLSLGLNIRKLMLKCEEGLFDGYIELYVHDKKNLEAMLKELKKIDGIYDVVRTDIA